MATLHAQFYRLDSVGQLNTNPEQVADILLRLSTFIDRDEALPLISPENLELGDDNQIGILPGVEPNLFYAAPEVLLDGKPNDRYAATFTVGLLLYFMLNGCSYYKDAYSLTRLSELREGNTRSLIPGSSPNARDVQGMLENFIEKATAWNPADRAAALNLVPTIIRQYTGVAAITYVCNGENIGMMQMPLECLITQLRRGAVVEGDDGKRYYIANNEKILFRPGRHPFVINVTETEPEPSAPDAVDEPSSITSHLMLRSVLTNKSVTLFPLDGTPKSRDVSVRCNERKQYQFLAVEADRELNRVVSNRVLYRITIAEQIGAPVYMIRVRYSPGEGCSVELLHEDGTPVTNQVAHFRV